MTEGAELFGRAAALQTFDRSLERARESYGAALCVVGQAGIGKTALLDAMAVRAASRGFAVGRTAGSPLQTSLPFGVAGGLVDIDGYAARKPVEGHPARRLTDHPAGLVDVDERAAARMLETIARRVLDLAAERPAVLFVDDAHWADPASLEALAVLGRRVAATPALLVVAAQRPRAPDPRLAELLATVAPELTIELAPLSPSETGQAIAGQLGATLGDAAARACHTVTAGHPLRVRLLAAELKRRRAAGDPIRPDHVEAAAMSSFEALIDRSVAKDPVVVGLLAAAAVLGGCPRLEQTAAIVGCEPAQAAVAAEILADMGLIADPAVVEPVHPLLAEAALARLDGRERSDLHGRAAARVRSARGAPDLVAAHLLHVDPAGDAEVAELLRDAARSELAAAAPSTAAEYLRRALAEPPPAAAIPELLVELGAAAGRAGDDDAADHLRRALDLAADERLRTRAVRELSAILGRRGDAVDAAILLEERIDQIADGPRDEVLALELDHAGLAPLSPALHRRVRDRLARDRWTLTGASPTERALLAARDEHEAMAAGTAEQAAELVLAALGNAPLGLRRQGALNAARTIWVLLRAERFSEAERLLEEGLANADRAGAIGDASLFHAESAYLQLQLGDLRAAEREAHHALDLAEAHGFGIARDMAAAYLGRALLEQDRCDEAIAAVERGGLGWDTPAPSPNRPGTFGSAQLLLTRGRLRIAVGETDIGLADLLEIAAQKRRIEVPNPAGFQWLGPTVEALIARGDRERAIDLLGKPLAAADRWGAPASLAQTLVAVGRARRQLEPLERAAALVRDSPARAVRAEVDVQVALARSDSSSKDSARELAAAAARAESCKMTRLARQARAALSPQGDGDSAAAGLAALSNRELEVVRLLVEGMTNDAIAEALSISPRTVQAHVANAMGKTGSRRRTELATLALRQQAV